MTKVLITGAHGFIGRHLAKYLASMNLQVAGLGHGTWPDSLSSQWGLSHWLNGDVTSNNLTNIQQIMGTPDVIYHLAGSSSVGASMTHTLENFTRTVGSTAELLEWMHQLAPDARLVAISSAAVYGPNYSSSIKENDELSPFSFYGSHKMMMEELCRSYAANFDLKVVIPRLFSVYGSGLKKQLLWDLCSKIAAGGEIMLGGTGDELRDWVNIEDVVVGLDLMRGQASTKAPAINIASGTATPVCAIAKSVARQWATHGEAPHKISFNGKNRPGDPFSLVADITTVTNLGFKPHTPLEQGTSTYVDWYRNRIGD